MQHLLEVKDLQVTFDTYGGKVHAVRGVDLHVDAGECLAIVGESGSGKSVTAQAVMGLLPMPPARITHGSIRWQGRELVGQREAAMRRVRGKEMGMIFQDPMTSLNPTMTVARQINEGLIKHRGVSRRDARARAREMLALVGIPHPEERLDDYPHQFSGGMRQRVMIALALACEPKLLIADEPTTALDVTIQAQILDLLRDLRRRLGMAIILITHDLGVVASLADRVAVMYAGKLVEQGSVDDLYSQPQHPYTWGLLRSVPRLDATERVPLTSIPGTPPDLFRPPSGCAFSARCGYAMKVCHRHLPEPTGVGLRHAVDCWLQHPYAPAVDNPVTGEPLLAGRPAGPSSASVGKGGGQ